MTQFKHVLYGLEIKTTELSEQSLEEALVEIAKMTDDRGTKISIRRKGLLYSTAHAESMRCSMESVYRHNSYKDLFAPPPNPHRTQVKRMKLDTLCDLWRAKFGMEPVTFVQDDSLYEAIAARLVYARRMKTEKVSAGGDANFAFHKAYQLKKERY